MDHQLENWIKIWKSCSLENPWMTWNSKPGFDSQNLIISDTIFNTNVCLICSFVMPKGYVYLPVCRNKMTAIPNKS